MANSNSDHMRRWAAQFRQLAARLHPELSRQPLAMAAELESKADKVHGVPKAETDASTPQLPLGEPYRIYLADRRRATVAHEAVFADNDDEALTIATLLFGACSDVCDRFELWHDHRPVDTFMKRLRSVDAAQLPLSVLESVTEHEERPMESRWAVAESKRLLEATAHLLKQVRPRPRLGF